MKITKRRRVKQHQSNSQQGCCLNISSFWCRSLLFILLLLSSSAIYFSSLYPYPDFFNRTTPSKPIDFENNGSVLLKVSNPVKDANNIQFFNEDISQRLPAQLTKSPSIDEWFENCSTSTASFAYVPQLDYKIGYVYLTDSLGFRMTVHSHGDLVSDAIFKENIWEIETTERIITHYQLFKGIGEQKLFIDVGANIGFFSSVIASLGHKVIAIEPFSKNVPLLKRTICSENPRFANNLQLYKVAISNVSGGHLCIASRYAENKGNAKVRQDDSSSAHNAGAECNERIPSSTLDDVILHINKSNTLMGRPWGMKIDIEGYETRALQGAKLFLTSFAPCRIWFEYQRLATLSSGSPEFKIFEILEKAGYFMYIIPGRNEPPDYKNKRYSTKISHPSWGSCPLCDFEARLQHHDCLAALRYPAIKIATRKMSDRAFGVVNGRKRGDYKQSGLK